ncbi:MAG TPA: M13 family metallopeptidase N-terminal domain-containing protein, partial [Paludibacteraceae bacterium]|nr:M13 family metallopeptidase N-terminal domain-containing protein [Paludibacteraceae bacterium]
MNFNFKSRFFGFLLLGIPFLILMMLMMNGCNSSKKTSGIDLTNLDTTARPGDDFYQYACGGWMKKNPLKGEYARYGTFDKLAEENTEQLRQLIEEIASQSHADGTVEQKIGDLYQLAMDSDRLNRDGYLPVLGELKKLSELKTTNSLIQILPELMLSGTDVYFSVYVDADPMNSSVYLTQTYQSGISLGEREYYLDQDAHSKEILEKYKQHVAKMFELFGFNSAEAQKNRDAVLSIETRLAKASYDRVKLRDPYANYHKMSLQDLGKEYSAISWKEFLTALGIPAVDSVNVSQKEFL